MAVVTELTAALILTRRLSLTHISEAQPASWTTALKKKVQGACPCVYARAHKHLSTLFELVQVGTLTRVYKANKAFLLQRWSACISICLNTCVCV